MKNNRVIYLPIKGIRLGKGYCALPNNLDKAILSEVESKADNGTLLLGVKPGAIVDNREREIVYFFIDFCNMLNLVCGVKRYGPDFAMMHENAGAVITLWEIVRQYMPCWYLYKLQTTWRYKLPQQNQS